jgi:hypothetical protein
MSAWQDAAPIPLTGADCFLRAFDAEARRLHGASHLSQLVLRLGAGFDLAGFRELVASVSRANPIVRAPIVRPWGCLPPVYDTPRARAGAAPRVTLHPDGGARSAALPAAFAARLNDSFDLRRGDLLRLDVVPYAAGAGGTDLALTWAHCLLDGSGSERFVEWLAACHRGDRKPDDLGPEEAVGAAAEGSAAPAPRAGPDAANGGARAGGLRARAYQARIAEFARVPPHSLAGPLRRATQAVTPDLLRFDEAETRRIVARASQQAGFLTPVLFHLAAVIRAHHAVFRKRGASPGSYVVPVVANLRPRGAPGAIFRTHVSMLWFQVFPEQADDFGTLLAALKEQRLARIKEGFLENGAAALDYARWAPKRAYAWMAARALRGELASFFFAYTGEFLPGLTHFCGAPIENGFHAAGVMAQPGSAAILCLRAGGLNAVHVRQAGVFSPGELTVFRDQLRADLVGVPADLVGVPADLAGDPAASAVSEPGAP